MLSKETKPQEAEKQALSAAILLVLTEDRTTTCFLCLEEKSLLLEYQKIYESGELDEALQAEASGPH